METLVVGAEELVLMGR